MHLGADMFLDRITSCSCESELGHVATRYRNSFNFRKTPTKSNLWIKQVRDCAEIIAGNKRITAEEGLIRFS